MTFTTVPSAGAKLRAATLYSLITELRPVFARKTSDETVNNSATLQNDDQLALAVEASVVYRLEMMLIVNSGTTPDFKFAWTYPSSLTMFYSAHIASPAGGGTGSDLNGPYIETTVPALGTLGSDQILRADGIVIVSSTAGTLQLQWAQNTANASNTTVKTGSHLILRRLT